MRANSGVDLPEIVAFLSYFAARAETIMFKGRVSCGAPADDLCVGDATRDEGRSRDASRDGSRDASRDESRGVSRPAGPAASAALSAAYELRQIRRATRRLLGSSEACEAACVVTGVPEGAHDHRSGWWHAASRLLGRIESALKSAPDCAIPSRLRRKYGN